MSINFMTTTFTTGASVSMFVASNLYEPEVEIWILSCLGGSPMTWAMVDVRNEHIDLLQNS